MCTFAAPKAEYLGHVISGVVSPNPSKVEAAHRFSPPKSVKGVKRFLIMASEIFR